MNTILLYIFQQECIIVCVVSLEDTDITPETVPYKQCREVRTELVKEAHMDKIIIVASSAICITVVVAVILFICCSRRRKNADSNDMPIKDGLTPASFLAAAAATGPPLASLGSLASLHHPHMTNKDWDQISMYSARSIPRPRMYNHHMDRGEFYYTHR
jgi:hypothetical protein